MLSFPAALAQHAFWFLDQLDPGNPAFNVAVRFHLAGLLDPVVLRRALNAIVARHEILRTQFEQDGDELMQVVLPAVDLPLELIDLTPLTESERRAETERQGTLEAERRFDLTRAPLIRANLLRLSPQEHMLQVTIHHAVCDGWSIGILTNELAALYPALHAGQPLPLPPLPIQFADYTLWQNDFLKGPAIAAQLEYWRSRLGGYNEPSLPSDWPRPPTKRWKGDIVSILLPTELTHRLQQISQQHDATLFMLFLTAFKVLLLRYTGQTDIGVGSPIAGRTKAELEPLIGVFINALVLRTDLSGNPPFFQALQAVRDTVLEAMANQDVPFELLVREIQPERDLSRNPLFQVNFTHQRDFVKPVQFEGVKLTPVPSRSPGAIFDLHFFMVERDGVWRASCDYNSDLFSRATAERALSHFQQLLVGIADAPERPIEHLELLPAEERHRLLVTWNDTSRPYSREQTVVDLIRQQVGRSPGKLAVQCEERRLSYAALSQAAGAVAQALHARGIGRGCRVGIYLERSVDLPVVVLGVLRSGAAYVPLDPALPAQRLRVMLEDSAASMVITHEHLRGNLALPEEQLLVVEQLPTISPGTAFASPDAASAEDPAYVIFTSGSTGRPKGVEVGHRSLLNFLLAMQREPGLRAEDVLVSVTTLSFDIAGLELFLPLITGATVVLASRGTASDGALLAALLEQSKATVLQGTPATWRLLLDSGWKGHPRLKALIGGEAVPRDLADTLAAQCASAWNMYGPTETTIWSTVGQLTVRDRVVSIGRPIDNTRIYITSAALQLQPTGVPGELLIGGDGLALGYVNRPDLTAERFIPDPFSNVPGARLYRTGDLARWRADGTLEWLGRMDHQIKIRGFRIELGEIEAALGQHPHVRQCAVAAKPAKGGGDQLVAYVVAEPGADPSADELQRHLRTILPEYMIPAAVVRLQQWPLTPNGKIDRKALPEPSRPEGDPAGLVAPRNETEARLVALFAQVLGIPPPSVHADFFTLGGHSLLAVRLMTAIRREFHVHLPLARLFDAPSVEQLARLVDDRSHRPVRWNSLVPIRPHEGKPALFLIHGAGGNLLLYRDLAAALAPDISVYGFQSQGLDHHAAPLKRIEEMAECYVRELLAFQPQGPYHLGGYCMGGAVAFEMARLLRRQGEQVGLVALFDTYNLSTVEWTQKQGARLAKFRQKVRFHLANLATLGPRNVLNYVREKGRIGREAGWGHLGAQLRRALRSDAAAVETYINEINHQAAWGYVPDRYDGNVLIFRPRTNYDFFPDPRMGWSAVVGGTLEVVELPINPHAMLIAPFVARLAGELKRHLAAPLSRA